MDEFLIAPDTMQTLRPPPPHCTVSTSHYADPCTARVARAGHVWSPQPPPYALRGTDTPLPEAHDVQRQDLIGVGDDVVVAARHPDVVPVAELRVRGLHPEAQAAHQHVVAAPAVPDRHLGALREVLPGAEGLPAAPARVEAVSHDGQQVALRRAVEALQLIGLLIQQPPKLQPLAREGPAAPRVVHRPRRQQLPLAAPLTPELLQPRQLRDGALRDRHAFGGARAGGRELRLLREPRAPPAAGVVVRALPAAAAARPRAAGVAAATGPLRAAALPRAVAGEAHEPTSALAREAGLGAAGAALAPQHWPTVRLERPQQRFEGEGRLCERLVLRGTPGDKHLQRV